MWGYGTLPIAFGLLETPRRQFWRFLLQITSIEFPDAGLIFSALAKDVQPPAVIAPAVVADRHRTVVDSLAVITTVFFTHRR